MSYTLNENGARIDALLDKAETAVQPTKFSGKTFLEASGLVLPNNESYHLPNQGLGADPAHTFAMASEVQATDAKLTELSAEVGGLIGQSLNYGSSILTTGSYIDCTNGNVVANGWRSYSEFIQVTEGDVLEFNCYGSMKDQGYAYYDSNKEYLEGVSVYFGSIQNIKTTAPKGAAYIRVTFVAATDASFTSFYLRIEREGALDALKKETEESLNATKEEIERSVNDLSSETKEHFTSQIFEPGNVGAGGESANEIVSRTNYIPCKKGDTISGHIYIVKLYDADYNWLGEEQPNNNNGFSEASHTIANESCAFVRLTARNTEMTKSQVRINGIAVDFSQIQVLICRRSLNTPNQRLPQDGEAVAGRD